MVQSGSAMIASARANIKAIISGRSEKTGGCVAAVSRGMVGVCLDAEITRESLESREWW